MNDTQRSPTADEQAGIDWWNAQSQESRQTMLKSPLVRGNPTAWQCWIVFGQQKRKRAKTRR